MKFVTKLPVATIIPMPLRAELVGAGIAKDHKAIDKIRAKIMKAYPSLYRHKDIEAERTAAEIPV